MPTTTTAAAPSQAVQDTLEMLEEFDVEHGGLGDRDFREMVAGALRADAAMQEGLADGGWEHAEDTVAEARRLRAQAVVAEHFIERPDLFDVALRLCERWAGTGGELIALVEQLLAMTRRQSTRPPCDEGVM